MELNQAIEERTSVRKYLDKEIEDKQIDEIIEAGIKAPSAKNLQPCKVFIVKNDKKLLEEVASNTIYYRFVKNANCLLLVFLDNSLSYSIEKDNQSLGAFVENMLLKITDLGLGGCWIGEIAKNSNQVKELCEINNENLQLACAIAIGYPEHVVTTPKKKFQEIVIGKK